MSIAILSLSLVGGDRAVRDEAQRVISLVEVAQDESLLQGREGRRLLLVELSLNGTEVVADKATLARLVAF